MQNEIRRNGINLQTLKIRDAKRTKKSDKKKKGLPVTRMP